MNEEKVSFLFDRIMNFDYLTPSIPIFLLLILVESLFGKHKNKKWFRINDTINSLSAGIFQQLSGIVLINSILLLE